MSHTGPTTRSMARNGKIKQFSNLSKVSKIRPNKKMSKETFTAVQDSITYKALSEDSDESEAGTSTANDAPSPSILPTSLLVLNQMTIIHLEQTGALAPGVLTIEPSGELQAKLSAEPDAGTMAGYFPNLEPYPGSDKQIPTWLTDYLLKELNVNGHGPPASCRGLYDHLQATKEDFGMNKTVWSTEGSLAYAAISLRRAIELVKDFADMKYVVKENYDEEVGNVIKNIRQFVGSKGDEDLSTELRMLIELAYLGPTVKDALTEPLNALIVEPYSRLVEKMEVVSKALRIELDHLDDEAEKVPQDAASSPDSGIGWS